ncbi:hypothetical protein PINS_up014243 [Pythium insidiosum]|nr:hypothetical protein PINS_up014243 [Pythium insidiosum]
MNGYLQRKALCRSEQQLMNELSKLLASKDYASKKMSELLKELAFFYVSPPPSTTLSHAVLKDLSALLAHLKDKKEDLRIARLVLCFLARIVDQLHVAPPNNSNNSSSSSSSNRSSAALASTQSLSLTQAAAAALLKALEASELSHASLPRQTTCLRLYGQLSRALGRPAEPLVARVRPLLLKSPVWGVLSGDKKVTAALTAKKDFVAQLAVVAAALHVVRFHVGADDQRPFVAEHLLQSAFLPSATAARHATATLLSLWERGSSECARAVATQLEAFVLTFRPGSLRLADPLATVYLLRLCGQISRLATTDGGDGDGRTKSKAASASVGASDASLLDFSFDAGGSGSAAVPASASPPPSPVARQRQRLAGVSVSSAFATRLKDLLLDIVTAAPTDAGLSRAVLLVAVEECVRDAPSDACVLKARGGVSLFEVAATALLKTLKDAGSNSVALHRSLRAVQVTAEALDGAVLQLTGGSSSSSSHMSVAPQFLDRITALATELLAHPNAFVAAQALRALVWLLPRPSTPTDARWAPLLARLVGDDDVDKRQRHRESESESQQAIAEALVQRSVTAPSLHGRSVDVAMLRMAQDVVLAWFQTQPRAWHADALVRLWTTALRKALVPMGDAVFAAVNVVLDWHQRHPSTAEDELHDDDAAARHVEQATLAFLVRHGAAFAVSQAAWSHALVLRLSQYVLLETAVARRLAVQVLAALYAESQRSSGGSSSNDVAMVVATLVRHLQQPPTQPSEANDDVLFASQIHSTAAKDAMDVQDLLLKSLEPRRAAATTISREQQHQRMPLPSQPTSSVLSAFDGMF